MAGCTLLLRQLMEGKSFVSLSASGNGSVLNLPNLQFITDISGDMSSTILGLRVSMESSLQLGRLESITGTAHAQARDQGSVIELSNFNSLITSADARESKFTVEEKSSIKIP